MARGHEVVRVEVQAYWDAGGMGHVFWYAAAAVLGCFGYWSVFLAVGLYIRYPIIPAAVLLAWEGASGILPHVLQRMSILWITGLAVRRMEISDGNET